MNPEIEVITRQLEAIYARARGRVAFIDESYKQFSDNQSESFYLVSAVLHKAENLARDRDAFIRAAHGKWWHTTEAFRLGMDDQIRSMVSESGTSSEYQYLSVQEPIPQGDMEFARRKCLLRVLASLGIQESTVAVIERRKRMSERSADASLIKMAAAEGLISRNLVTFQSTPEAEPLLWGPDVFCWIIRRALAVSDFRWVELFEGNAAALTNARFKELKTKGPQRSAESGCGPGDPVVPVGEGESRSSYLSMPFSARVNQVLHSADIRAIGSPIDDVLLTSWLAANFPRV